METLLEAPFRHIVWTPPIPRPKERLEMTWKEQRKRRVRVEGRDVAAARPIWHRRGNLCRAGGRGRGLGPRITTTQQRLVVVFVGRFGRVPHLSALRFAGRQPSNCMTLPAHHYTVHHSAKVQPNRRDNLLRHPGQFAPHAQSHRRRCHQEQRPGEWRLGEKDANSTSMYFADWHRSLGRSRSVVLLGLKRGFPCFRFPSSPLPASHPSLT